MNLFRIVTYGLMGLLTLFALITAAQIWWKVEGRAWWASRPYLCEDGTILNGEAAQAKRAAEVKP